MRGSQWLLRAGVVVLVVLAAALAYLGLSASPPGPSVDASGIAPPDAGPEVDAGSPRTLASLPPPIEARPRRDARPDILLLTIDTIRADHVSGNGYARDTTPTLDALAARRGTRFSRAYAAASWTIPSIASLLTGVLPSQHGIEHAHLEEDGGVLQETISPELPSLPAALRAAGYRTFGITATDHFHPSLGWGHGFDDYECLGFVDRDVVQGSLASRLDELHTLDAPYFLWIHVVDPHIPYTPTEPQFTEWWPASRPRYPDLDVAAAGIGIGAVVLRDHIPVREALDYSIAAWDSEIRAADDYLARLLAQLDDGHLAVVVAGDHGEEFNEHHGMGHGNTLFEEVVHVPLVIALPDRSASVSSHMVSLMDVLPTLLEVAGAPIPADLGGRSLMPVIRSEEFPLTRDIVMETGGPAIVRAIFDGRYKYGERVEPRPVQALFDLETDPGEQTLILADHPEIADPLRARMEATLAAARARRPEVVTAERPIPEQFRAQFRALGYGN